MKVEEVLFMNGGVGEESYAQNSSLQKTVMAKVRWLLEEDIQSICSNTSPECLTIADFGCSSGPNALSVLRSIIDITISTSQSSGHPIPEFNVFMNDLPQNDFNSIFKLLPSFLQKLEEEKGVEISYCISGTPGSFHGKLFPKNLIHFMHSSYSLHWLSQVPKEVVVENRNKDCIYAKKGSLPMVLEACRRQFASDFTSFLRCRSTEIIHGGRIILTLIGTRDDEACHAFELTSKALNKMASEGLINKKKLEVFNLPYYRPTAEQVKQLVEAEGSFVVRHLDTFNLPWHAAATSKEDAAQQTTNAATGAKFVTCTLRVVLQPLLAREFGEEVMDELFHSVEEMVRNHLAAGEVIGVVTHALSLIRRD